MQKNIYLSDFLDTDFFDTKIGKDNYLILDKEDILQKLRKQTNFDRDVINYLSNSEISKSFVRLLRNKKINNVIYLMYSSMPVDVMSSIKNTIAPSVPEITDISYFIITNTEDLKSFNYLRHNNLFRDIYTRNEV